MSARLVLDDPSTREMNYPQPSKQTRQAFRNTLCYRTTQGMPNQQNRNPARVDAP